MIGDLKRLPAVFYLTARGNEPVRQWLKALSPADRRTLGRDIATLEYGWPVGMPVCRSLGGGLWEVRSDLGDARTARVLFCIAHGRMVLLHGFIKKARKTPQADLKIARERQKKVEA